MIEKYLGAAHVLEFPNLVGIPGLRHGVFTREGGVSVGAFDSLNVSISVKDQLGAVCKNRSVIRRAMGDIPLIFIRQVHGVGVVVFSKDEKSAVIEEPDAMKEGDAIISDVPGLNIAVQTADCQAILLCDPVHRVIGNVHSGWRGSTRNIIAHTVSRMMEVFGTLPSDILVGIGPSLGPCCAEFVHYRRELPESFWRYADMGHRFDFWAISRDQLRDAGVPEENIIISGLCTRCRTDLFFSYRAETITGRFAAVIGWEEGGGDGPRARYDLMEPA